MGDRNVDEKDPPIQVATVTSSISRRGGGLFYAIRPLSRALAARGLRVEVMGLIDDDWARDQELWRPVRATAYPTAPLIPIGYSPKLRSALGRLDVAEAVFHLHGLWLYPSKACRDVSRAKHRPRVISPHGMLDAWALKNSGWKKRLIGALYEYDNLAGSHCIHALCDAEMQSIREFGLKNPIVVIPNGVDLPTTADASPSDPAPQEWRSKSVLLFLGRVHPKKGLEPLVEAWSMASGAATDWRLAIAGPNELGHQEELQSRIDRLGLGGVVRFVGPQTGGAKEAWFRRANAFALTSFSEGFSMAILEAMSFGLPVLLSPQCNFPQAEAFGAALSAEPNADSVAVQLRRLFEMSPLLRAEMGQRGRALVARDYTWDRVAQQMNDVYDWLLGKRGQPATLHLN